MNDMMLMILCVFGAVAMLGFVIGRALTGNSGDTRLRSRLTSNQSHDPIDVPVRLCAYAGFMNETSTNITAGNATRMYPVKRPSAVLAFTWF